jgi:hypothetical protein
MFRILPALLRNEGLETSKGRAAESVYQRGLPAALGNCIWHRWPAARRSVMGRSGDAASSWPHSEQCAMNSLPDGSRVTTNSFQAGFTYQ